MNILQIITTAAIIMAAFSASAHNREKAEFDSFLDSLNRAQRNRLEKAHSIRRYVSDRLVRGPELNAVDSFYMNAAYNDIDPWTVLSMFDDGLLKGNCGLASKVTAKIFAYAGYEAVIYDCGFAGTPYTHLFPVVNIYGKWYIEDAYYNYSTDNEFFEVIDLQEKGLTDRIEIESNTIVYTVSTNTLPLNSILRYAHLVDMEDGPNGLVLEFSVNVERIIKYKHPDVSPLLLNAGLPEHYLSIILLPLGTFNNMTLRQDNAFLERVMSASR